MKDFTKKKIGWVRVVNKNSVVLVRYLPNIPVPCSIWIMNSASDTNPQFRIMDDSWIQMDAANPYQTKTFLLLFQLRKFRSNGNDFFKYWTFSFKNFSEIFCAFLLELDQLELDTDHEGYSQSPLPTHPEQVPLGIGVNGNFSSYLRWLAEWRAGNPPRHRW